MIAIPFAKPDMTEWEMACVSTCIKNGWLTSGPMMRDFEEKLSRRFKSNALALSSATAGLHMVLMGLGIGPGDEVILPALTFAATINAVLAVGAKPVLCDVDEESLCSGWKQLEPHINDRTKAVILVHFAGACHPDLAQLIANCRGWGLKIIEDAAHAFGTELHGTQIGCYPTDATVFSFYATKCITTGEGGAVVTQSEELTRKIKTMRLHGISRDVFDRYRSDVPSWEYDVVEPGWKYNLSDLAASIGTAQIQRDQYMRHRRSRIAAQYNGAFESSYVTPYRMDGHAWHLYTLDHLEDRNDFIEYLFAQGVGASVHFKPLYRMTAFADPLGPQLFPVTEAYWQSCASIPIYSAMTDSEVNRVVEVVKAYRD